MLFVVAQFEVKGGCEMRKRLEEFEMRDLTGFQLVFSCYWSKYRSIYS